MATLHAIGGTIDIDMRFTSQIDHASQAAPTNTSEYSWNTTSGNLIHALSFADDIAFNATSPLGGTVHALQVVNSYVVGGVVGDLVSMASGNIENYWRPILSADTTIFASNLADFVGAGDFVNVAVGENLTGSDDLFEGAAPSAGGPSTSQTFYGDADFVNKTAQLTGGADTINMRADGTISGDADGVFGKLTGGADDIVVEGPAILNQNSRVTGDVVFVSDLEQAIAPTVIGGDDTIIVKQYGGGAISGDILDAFNAALGTTTGGKDVIDASTNVGSVSIFGDVQNLGNHTVKGGNDTLTGAIGGSVISGDAGNVSGGQLFVGADTITGGAGNDALFGDFVSQSGGTISTSGTFTGSDKIFGNGGNDGIFGQLGNDTIDGGMGDDFLDGGVQSAGVGDIVAFNGLNVAVSVDLVMGFAFGQGVDTLTGFEGIRGSNSADNLAGDNLNNRIEGLNGDDKIFGRGGTDTLIGGSGRDNINGGAGIDTITGGAAGDTLNGSTGADIFNYDLVSDSGLTAATRDLILGFVQGAGGDRIDLNTIDAQDGTVGNQDFTFIGGAAFSAEGQVRFASSGGHTFIEVNTTGASGAEMSIDLSGTFVMTGADFIL